MLANATARADIQAASVTTIEFAATTALTERPIRFWARSGRLAVVTVAPAALTISGTAGTRYVYASLAAPSGDPYSTASGGLLYKLLHTLPWSRTYLYDPIRCVHPGDGTLVVPERNSAVTLVETASATAPDTHHVLLGQFECVGGQITSITSYEGQIDVTVAAFIHGACVLSRSSASDLILMPRDGRNLTINGTARNVPDAGVTMAVAALTPATFYHIYATWSGAAIVLAASTTAPAQHTDGVEIKTGDSTHTYVGTAYVETGPVWSATVPVHSTFHDPTPTTLIHYTGNPAFTLATSSAETSIFTLSVPKIRGGTLGTDEHLEIVLIGDVLNNTGASRSMVSRIKYGGTTIATESLHEYTASATRSGFHVLAYLSAAGATNAQAARTYFFAPPEPGVTGGTSNDGAVLEHGHSSHSSMAIDSTADQTFDVTLQNGSASANMSTRVFSCFVRRIRQ